MDDKQAKTYQSNKQRHQPDCITQFEDHQCLLYSLNRLIAMKPTITTLTTIATMLIQLIVCLLFRQDCDGFPISPISDVDARLFERDRRCISLIIDPLTTRYELFRYLRPVPVLSAYLDDELWGRHYVPSPYFNALLDITNTSRLSTGSSQALKPYSM